MVHFSAGIAQQFVEFRIHDILTEYLYHHCYADTTLCGFGLSVPQTGVYNMKSL
jgi:hypothetical protein